MLWTEIHVIQTEEPCPQLQGEWAGSREAANLEPASSPIGDTVLQPATPAAPGRVSKQQGGSQPPTSSPIGDTGLQPATPVAPGRVSRQQEGSQPTAINEFLESSIPNFLPLV